MIYNDTARKNDQNKDKWYFSETSELALESEIPLKKNKFRLL